MPYGIKTTQLWCLQFSIYIKIQLLCALVVNWYYTVAFLQHYLFAILGHSQKIWDVFSVVISDSLKLYFMDEKIVHSVLNFLMWT